MKIQLQIPEYLSIKDWKYFNSLDHLNDSEKMISLISKMGGKDIEEVKEWTPAALSEVYKTLLASFEDLTPQFYPIIELDGVKYGFKSLTSMTTGEYIDLEKLAKYPVENLEEIMAILYRPITNNRFSGIKWAFKSTHKVALGEAENLFKYYEVEKYDNSKRSEQANKLSNIPASIGLGALSFFLVVGTYYSASSSLSSLPPKQQMKEVKKMNQELASINIGDGLLRFITLLQHPSYQSMEKAVSWSVISSSYLTTWLTSKTRTNAMNRLENRLNVNIE
tara:strand:- start:772 stop:1608 length:837 start_codon:yes stop_codon:yes gene_type:complete